MDRMTVGLRLTSIYSAVFGSCMLILFGASYYLVAQKLYQAADRSAEREAYMLAKAIAIHWDRLEGGEAERLEAAMQQIRAINLERGIMEQGKYIQILDRSDRMLYRSPNLVDRPLPFDRAFLEKAFLGEAFVQTGSLGIHSSAVHRLRILTLPFQKDDHLTFFVQIGYYPEAIEWTLHRLRKLLFTLLPGAVLLASLAGWTMTRKRLRPINRIVEAARRVGAGDLSQKVEAYRGRDEIGALVEAFNQMMARFNETLAEQRRFTDDAVHELRTPLSIMRAEAEVTLRKAREVQEYQQVLRSMVEEIEFMSKIVEGPWILSQGESGGIVMELEPLPLDGLLREVYEESKILARGKSLSVSLDKLEEVVVQGDKRWVKQLLLNLVDNAIKYTPAGGRITLALEQTQHYALILIEDTGSGIPEESLPRVFDRFYQVDKTKARETGGCGLGLSICKWIAEAHAGTIEISSCLGYGTKVAVRLPL